MQFLSPPTGDPTMPTSPIDPNQLDAHVQGAVLFHLLTTYPAWQTEDELVLAVLHGDADFAARDDARRAVRDLAADGLVHRHGRFLLPTRTAVRCHALLDDAVAGATG